MSTTYEYILWNNCQGSCKFCLQHELKSQNSALTEEEMLHSIAEVQENIDKSVTKGDNVLIVGGEVLLPRYNSVTKALEQLFLFLANKIKSGTVQYFYINTNLMYSDNTLLDILFNIFNTDALANHLKFTTSYDIYGRFRTTTERDMVLDNLAYIRDTYPKIKTVVNVIITKQLFDSYVNKCQTSYAGAFDPVEFKKKYKLSYINFIPYIPSIKNREMDIEFKEILRVLLKVNDDMPGTLDFYINDLDVNQDKVLLEYKKDKGLTPCTASYSECGHNSNFSKVCQDKECFICKLKNIFN